MNILFFLKPKADLVYIYDHFTLRQALEKMKHHGYAAIPVIDKPGHYVGTLRESDLLWTILEHSAFDNRQCQRGYRGFAADGHEPELYPGDGRPRAVHRHRHAP